MYTRARARANDKVCFLIKNLPPAVGIGGERIVTSRDSRSQTRADATHCSLCEMHFDFVAERATPLYKYQRRVVMSAMFNRSKERHDATASSIHHYASGIVCHGSLTPSCQLRKGKTRTASVKISQFRRHRSGCDTSTSMRARVLSREFQHDLTNFGGPLRSRRGSFSNFKCSDLYISGIKRN